jgi:hypothetical protein
MSDAFATNLAQTVAGIVVLSSESFSEVFKRRDSSPCNDLQYHCRHQLDQRKKRK